LKLKCTKFDFGWGSVPDPLGSLQRSQTPYLDFRSQLLSEREGREDDIGVEKGGEGGMEGE